MRRRPNEREFVTDTYRDELPRYEYRARRRLSSFEKPTAEAYRKLFFDLDHFGRLSRDLARPGVKRILEIGCGDGAVADRITAAFPSANYVGIDVAEGPGSRLLRPPRARRIPPHVVNG
jgi:2-polyprenyl-6-hydroxyphenyl methylase/3-demethylubiquinone-9 3-methyltransferase